MTQRSTALAASGRDRAREEHQQERKEDKARLDHHGAHVDPAHRAVCSHAEQTRGQQSGCDRDHYDLAITKGERPQARHREKADEPEREGYAAQDTHRRRRTGGNHVGGPWSDRTGRRQRCQPARLAVDFTKCASDRGPCKGHQKARDASRDEPKRIPIRQVLGLCPDRLDPNAQALRCKQFQQVGGAARRSPSHVRASRRDEEAAPTASTGLLRASSRPAAVRR